MNLKRKKHESETNNGEKKHNEPESNLKENEKTPSADEINSPKEPSESALEEKINEINEKYLRLLAEYENFRKRTVREMMEISKNANEKFLKALLPILDNLDRATEHKKDKKSIDEYINGIELIENQLREILATAGLKPIEAEGKPFDPNFHDAIFQMVSDKHDSGIVISEAEKGYMLSDKVLRHAKVVVSK
jgi:molecular chaperone GrpE